LGKKINKNGNILHIWPTKESWLSRGSKNRQYISDWSR